MVKKGTYSLTTGQKLKMIAECDTLSMIIYGLGEGRRAQH
jgi:hypothetical protein